MMTVILVEHHKLKMLKFQLLHGVVFFLMSILLNIEKHVTPSGKQICT